MKVKTLIKKLSRLDPNLEVFVDGYEDGIESTTSKSIKLHQIKLNTRLASDGDLPCNEGEHEISHHNGDCTGVVIHRREKIVTYPQIFR